MLIKYKPSNEKLLEKLKEVQSLFNNIKINCENRNEELFVHGDLEKIVEIMQFIERNLSIKDVPTTFYKKVLECDDFAVLLKEFKKEMEGEEDCVRKKQERFRQFYKMMK